MRFSQDPEILNRMEELRDRMNAAILEIDMMIDDDLQKERLFLECDKMRCELKRMMCVINAEERKKQIEDGEIPEYLVDAYEASMSSYYQLAKCMEERKQHYQDQIDTLGV